MVSEKGHAEWRVSHFQAGTAALLSLEPFTQCCSSPAQGGALAHAGVVGTLVYGCRARPRAATSRDGGCSLSLCGTASPQGQLLPTPQERKGSRRFYLCLHFCIIHTHLLGIPLRAAVKLYRWSTRAQPSALLKGMSEGPGHPRFDPASKTASPGAYLPRGRGTEGGAAVL